MTDSKYFTTTKKGEIFELKSELNNDKKEKKREAVKKVSIFIKYDGCRQLFSLIYCLFSSHLTLFNSCTCIQMALIGWS
jgi:AP-1 complex subunit beta-1